jgi:hypothetical protein
MKKLINIFLLFLSSKSIAINFDRTKIPDNNTTFYNSLDDNQKLLINHVIKSIENAYLGKSKLTEEIFKIPGMSSKKGRSLLNNICSLEGAKYLEVGTWMGSTFVSALYKNENTILKAVAIDNFAEFNSGNVKQKLLENINNFLVTTTNKIKFYDTDCFNFDINKICDEKFNIYFYDGEHTVNSQYLAFTYYNDILSDTFIAIVDDYNWSYVKDGTQKAFKNLNYQILYEQFLPSKYNGDLDSWWNGTYIAVISKK